VDFDKAVLISGADVRLTVADTTESQKADSAGSFIFKVPGSKGNLAATLNVSANGFERFSENLSRLDSMQTVYLKHASDGGAGGGKGAAIGARVGAKLNKAEQEQIKRIDAKLPPYRMRQDSVRLTPHP
jgi:hypothetical protein